MLQPSWNKNFKMICEELSKTWWQDLITTSQRLQIFVEHTFVGNSIKHLSQKQEESYQISSLKFYMVTYVERLKRCHLLEQNTSSHSLMTDHNLCGCV